ncbi:hypothetical protein [Kineosporia sp. NBRC 101731]|uniref:hypothetical protein n=1 Tax=Kineosporia sp. NBRC 101731 TaxID=3032199 RepID=UPI0024A02586|nr:hypothetical protein [Kineosporia sp. NBRC 101731]GLY27772.1 hypothetical protein Kisp02_11370 [Kineosporia sp. NBRC 101731]
MSGQNLENDQPVNPTKAFEPGGAPEPEAGSSGYLTSGRPPQPSPAPGPGPGPDQTPRVPPQPQEHPGIRTTTVAIGLILLIIGLTAVTSQLAGISLNPAAVAFAIMLAVGVTLLGAALKKSPRS